MRGYMFEHRGSLLWEHKRCKWGGRGFLRLCGVARILLSRKATCAKTRPYVFLTCLCEFHVNSHVKPRGQNITTYDPMGLKINCRFIQNVPILVLRDILLFSFHSLAFSPWPHSVFFPGEATSAAHPVFACASETVGFCPELPSADNLETSYRESSPRSQTHFPRKSDSQTISLSLSYVPLQLASCSHPYFFSNEYFNLHLESTSIFKQTILSHSPWHHTLACSKMFVYLKETQTYTCVHTNPPCANCNHPSDRCMCNCIWQWLTGLDWLL